MRQEKHPGFKELISHAKEYGYIIRSSDIYDGLGAVYDYLHNGVELKNNIREYWWKAMVQLHENIVGIDAAVFMHPTTWKASGHVDAFNDPLIDNKDSKKRYRADVLVEEYAEKLLQKANKEVVKAAKRFGEAFDEEQFKNTHPKYLKYLKQRDEILQRLARYLDNNDLKAVKELIEELGIVCPVSGSRNWTDVKQFNLMFATKIGASAGSSTDLYLRPETAQGIFVNFLHVQKNARMKIPFGIAQTGKAFRNEIIARQFIFRMREFEQMEMQFFVKPGEQMHWYEVWKKRRMAWHLSLGIPQEKYRFHTHEKLAHYADAAADIEYEFPFGFKELEGIHSRTDFDLKAHEQYAGKKLRYYDTENDEHYVPYVIETSIGLDRMVLAVLSNALVEETLDDGSIRTVLRIPPVLAPVKAAILPLVKKDGLPEIARQIRDRLKYHMNTTYDEKDAIGRRYRRQDAAGTPYCITVDHQTKEDGTVTLRDRDTMTQERIHMDQITGILTEKTAMQHALQKIENYLQ